MSTNSKRALVTCESTPKFIEQIQQRGFAVHQAGWGKSGIPLDKASLITALKDCDIAFIELEEIDAEVIEKCPKLGLIGVARGTPINVDMAACKLKGISVTTTPARNADAVADYCIAMMIVASRSIFSSSLHLREKGWNYEGQLPYLKFRGFEIGNKKIGLYGLGNIGLKVAKRLHYGFGVKVFFYDPFVEICAEAEKVKSLDELFEICDIISLHAPINEATKNSITQDQLEKLGRKGVLINAARAGLIEEIALLEALEQNRIKGAVLDVFWNEPLESNSNWLKLENVICTPHIAGATFDVIQNHCEKLISDLDNWSTREMDRNPDNG